MPYSMFLKLVLMSVQIYLKKIIFSHLQVLKLCMTYLLMYTSETWQEMIDV